MTLMQLTEEVNHFLQQHFSNTLTFRSNFVILLTVSDSILIKLVQRI